MTEGGEGEEESVGQVGDGEEKPGSQRQEEPRGMRMVREDSSSPEQSRCVSGVYLRSLSPILGLILIPTRL